MIKLQEDEVDNHDTSTIDEVSFAANLSVASCLKMQKHSNQPNKQTAKTWQTNQTKNAKQHGEPTNQIN